MSDDTTRREDWDDEHGQPGGLFVPKTVDEAIAGRLAGVERDDRGEGDEARLVAALAGTYALPAEAGASLARVRSRLRQAAARRPTWEGEGEDEAEFEVPVTVKLPESGRERRPMRRLAALRAVAAVLVVALLGGGFFALLHGQPGTGSRSAGVWQDVSVTHSHLTAPLDFAPARGLTYAVAETGGVIYACDANSLWYSVDAGRTYAPFPLAYPASDTSRPDELCNMDTAPGAPGIFVVVYGKQTQVEYAEAGDGAWRTLGIPDAVQNVANGGRSAPLDVSDIAQAVSADLDHARLRVVGNWVFVLAQAPSTRLVATPDFGTTWYQLDVGLEAQKLQCAGFAVAKSDPLHLYCDTVSLNQGAVTAGAGLWESVDGGTNWRQMTLPFSGRTDGVKTSGAYLYVLANGPGITETVWRRAITGGVWERVAALPPPEFNTEPLPPPSSFSMQNWGVGLDDTVYAWIASDDGTTVTVRVFALAPGSSTFGEVGAQYSATFRGKWLTLELGDTGPGGSPALYLHDKPTSANDGSQPLYRLPLPARGTRALIDTTPLPAPAPTATATPAPAAACTTAPGNVAEIQPGGFGATLDTFDARWGQHHGVAAGSIYFGPDTSSGNWVVSAAEPASNGRVYLMTYHVDPAKTMTLAQAEAVTATIVPRDATRTAGPRTTASGVEVDYCSAALIAAFPLSVQMSVAPLYHDGRIVVMYDVDADGNVMGIAFWQHAF